MYRDSRLGLCVDIGGTDGNGFVMRAYAHSMDRLIGVEQTFEDHLSIAHRYMNQLALNFDSYILLLCLFQNRYPVTLVNIPEEINAALSRCNTRSA